MCSICVVYVYIHCIPVSDRACRLLELRVVGQLCTLKTPMSGQPEPFYDHHRHPRYHHYHYQYHNHDYHAHRVDMSGLVGKSSEGGGEEE